MLAIYDASDNLLIRFNYADGRMPVSMTRGGGTYYLTYDQVGSLRTVTDSSGNVIKKIDYDSFGNIISDTDPSFNVMLGFAGGLTDPDTGLVHFGYRDYNPDTGRWTAKDPILFNGGGTDLYGYVLNDPVGGVDPEGKKVRVTGNQNDVNIMLSLLSKMLQQKITLDSSGNVSRACGKSEAVKWFNEIVDSSVTIDLAMGENTCADFGGACIGKYNNTITIDPILLNPNQNRFWYMSTDLKNRPTEPQAALAHELLGHGLDRVRGDWGQNEYDAKNRENVVRHIIGLPSRYQ